MRRGVVLITTLLAALGTAAAVAPGAAAASPEYRLRWSHVDVSTIRDNIAVGDDLCNAVALVGGVATGPLGTTMTTGALVATVTGAAGWAMCGHSDPKLRDAVDEAFYRRCGIDAYFTDGPLSYDASYRYVVCP